MSEQLLPVICLKVNDGQGEKFFEVGSAHIIVGRSDRAKFQVADPHCSGTHCKFYQAEGHLFVEDLQSKNGTFINSIKVIRKEIFTGDIVRIGDTHIEVYLERTPKEAHKVVTFRGNGNERELRGINLQTIPEFNRLNPMSAIKENVNLHTAKKKDAEMVRKHKDDQRKELLGNNRGKVIVAGIIDTILLLFSAAAPYLIYKLALKMNKAALIEPHKLSFIVGGAIMCAFVFFIFNNKFSDTTIGEKITGLGKILGKEN